MTSSPRGNNLGGATGFGDERHSRLTLGTAQFGFPYGIANQAGMPSSAEVERIVHRAIESGVTHIDTARAYAASEERLGSALAGGWRERVSIVTKLAPITDTEPGAARAATEASVFQSCRALRSDYLDVVLLHLAETRTVANGAAWECLLSLRERGVVRAVGVSAQSPPEVRDSLLDPAVDVLQIPFNLLDRRWTEDLFGRPVLIYARSALLQGLLTGLAADRWPKVPGVDPAGLVKVLEDLTKDLGRESLTDLALAFVRGHRWIHSIVVGMESESQLESNLRLFAAPALTDDEIRTVRESLPELPETLVNPALWPSH